MQIQISGAVFCKVFFAAGNSTLLHQAFSVLSNMASSQWSLYTSFFCQYGNISVKSCVPEKVDVKCCNGFSIGSRKMRFHQLLFFIHNKNTAADKRNAECCEFIPDQWCDPFKIVCGAHGGYLCTNPVDRCTFNCFLACASAFCRSRNLV